LKDNPLLKNTTRGSRRALGDITNRGRESKNDKKKKVSEKKFHLPEEYEPPFSMPSPTSSEVEKENEAVEMYQREMDDIDSRDQNNPLSAVEYVNDMYYNFRNLEREYKVSGSYLKTRSSCVNNKGRAELVDWMVRR